MPNNDYNKTIDATETFRKMIVHGNLKGMISEDILLKLYNDMHKNDGANDSDGNDKKGKNKSVFSKKSISRIPIRRAILALEIEGFLRVFAKKGTLVVTPNQEDIIDAKDCFLDILMKSFSTRYTKKNHDKLKEIVCEMKKHSSYFQDIKDMKIAENYDETQQHKNVILDQAEKFFIELLQSDLKTKIFKQVFTTMRMGGIHSVDYVALADNFQKIADTVDKEGKTSSIIGMKAFKEILGQLVGQEAATAYFKSAPFVARV
jgi:hypothetical protein